ncbi:MAG: ribosome assembly factor SBDS [Candidatus Woesearchaeota archaeon]
MVIPTDEAHIVRLKKFGDTFEVLADIDKLMEVRSQLKRDKITKEEFIDDLDEIIASYNIFKDSKKGLKASGLERFEKENKDEIIFEILIDGEMQIPAEHKRRLIKNKRKQIVDDILENSINPKTDTPHPKTRIESALDEVKFKINEHKSVDEHVEEALNKIKRIIPIQYGKTKIRIVLPAKYSSKYYSSVTRLGKVINEIWADDGSLLVDLEIPKGKKKEVISKASSLCSGELTITDKF